VRPVKPSEKIDTLLKSIEFNEDVGADWEWTLDDLTLSQTNLLVGKNATGKSRTMNVNNFLGDLMAGRRQEVISTGSFRAVFENGSHIWKYSLHFANAVVAKEEPIYDNVNVLHGGDGGIGQIDSEVPEEQKTERLRFRVSGARPAVVAKYDELQHPFVTPLIEWRKGNQSVCLGLGLD